MRQPTDRVDVGRGLEFFKVMLANIAEAAKPMIKNPVGFVCGEPDFHPTGTATFSGEVFEIIPVKKFLIVHSQKRRTIVTLKVDFESDIYSRNNRANIDCAVHDGALAGIVTEEILSFASKCKVADPKITTL